MESKTEGVIESLINHGFSEGFGQGFGEGRKSIIDRLLENHLEIEVADFLGISFSELSDMIK